MDPSAMLAAAMGYLKRIADRLAPSNPTSQIIKFLGVEPANSPVVVQLSGPWNTLYVNLQSGTVNVYFGVHSSTNSAPDLVLDPTHNGLIPIGQRSDATLCFTNQSTAKGSIFVELY